MDTINPENCPIELLNVTQDDSRWRAHTLSRCSEDVLIFAAIHALALPLRGKQSSFILHTPLELQARVLLLPRVSDSHRARALKRIADIAIRYVNEDAQIEPPAERFSSMDYAIDGLREGMRTQDALLADQAVTYLAQHATPKALRSYLFDEIAPLLAAAAHAPIFLAHLEDLCAIDPRAAFLIRPTVRRLTLENAPTISWHLSGHRHHTSSHGLSALANPPSVTCASTSIAPMVSTVEKTGLLAHWLGAFLEPDDFGAAQRAMLRVAAASMLQEDDSRTAYGWTHCLTLPLGILQNANVSRNPGAVSAIAATHVFASRAALGKVKIEVEMSAQPTRPLQQLIDEAACHHDAHVAKYMLACVDAARLDDDYACTYYAAAQRLLDWWHTK